MNGLSSDNPGDPVEKDSHYEEDKETARDKAQIGASMRSGAA